METYKYIEGIISEVRDLKTKAGNPFLAVKIQNELTTIEASCFEFELFEKLKEGEVYSFKIEEKGNYKNIIELNTITNDELVEMIKSTPKEIKDDRRELYITLNGKTYVTQAGLLNEAHKKGLKSIVTELIEFKDKEIAVVKATATSKDGSIYTGYGDATKDNVNSMIVKHLLRMAETRAINRSLRQLTNIGVTSIEELEN